MQATKKMTGGKKKHHEEVVEEVKEEDEKEKKDSTIISVSFDPGHYTVMECVGTFDVTVTREGGDANATILVDYKTEDGTANAGGDYVAAEGTLVFLPGETSKTFPLEVIDDDAFEEDEHFYVRLSNLRLGSPDPLTQINGSDKADGPVKMELAPPFV